ncbi:M81 family metallopeptidase [uncultured Maritalea sp.]|uniref:M81 family metallopeptidase n=1 Tax=uncultured Maritalea sp. TaxID=757249 RepID=UPI002623B5FD|nr:M81 family metallopeptidase [uncultured Maritalea sp.]
MRIAVGGLHTECSTYTDVLQKTVDFKVLRGDDLMISDFFSFLPRSKAEIVPLMHARSTPGGAVSRSTYDLFKQEFLSRLELALTDAPIDGLYLAMHGAVHVDGLEDAEGDWIEAARKRVGPSCPISVSFDLHGNLSQKIIDQIDLFTAFRHAPHIDTLETMERALNNLINVVETGERPFVGWVPIPVLLPGERTSTVDEPAKSLYAQLPGFDKIDGITDASLMVGYVWADVERANAAAVITGTNEVTVRQSAEQLAQSYFDVRAEFKFGPVTGSLSDMLAKAIKSPTHPVVLTDSGDNPGGGGVGDRVCVLRYCVQNNVRGALIIGIADAPAVQQCFKLGEGVFTDIWLGATLDPARSTPWQGHVRIEKIAKDNKRGNRIALLNCNGIRIVISDRRYTFHEPENVEPLGLDLTKERIVVIKCGYISPAMAQIANPNLMALTDGAVNQDIASLQNLHRPKPTYPFESDFAFRPKCKTSARVTSK